MEVSIEVVVVSEVSSCLEHEAVFCTRCPARKDVVQVPQALKSLQQVTSQLAECSAQLTHVGRKAQHGVDELFFGWRSKFKNRYRDRERECDE